MMSFRTFISRNKPIWQGSNPAPKLGEVNLIFFPKPKLVSFLESPSGMNQGYVHSHIVIDVLTEYFSSCTLFRHLATLDELQNFRGNYPAMYAMIISSFVAREYVASARLPLEFLL